VGLGLSIARDIAQAHGGSVTLRNRQPHGLDATLRLPRTAAA
jgi:signal transduction histidine kinase